MQSASEVLHSLDINTFPLDTFFDSKVQPLGVKTAEEYNLLSKLYKSKNMYDKVIYFYTKSLEIRKDSLGFMHRKTAESYKNLADAYYKKMEMNEAVKFYHKALEIRENIFGIGHSKTAEIYGSLGNVHMSNGEFKESSLFYRKALHIQQEVSGDIHLDTAKAYHALAYFYASQLEFEYALPLFKKVLSIKVSLLNKNHISLADSYTHLAMCQYHLFQNNEASYNLKKSIDIQEFSLDGKDEKLLLLKRNLKEIQKNTLVEKKESFFKKIKKYISS